VSHFIRGTIQIYVVILIAISLTNCGGGVSNTLPVAATNNTPPMVVKTIPSSEKIKVSVISFIDVTFSKAIANFDTNQVSIYPFDVSGSIKGSRIALKDNPFVYSNSSKTVTIKPMSDFLPDKKYQVVISAVKDSFGNEMVGECVWEFTTGTSEFGIGKTGVCGGDADVGPGEPINVNAAVEADGSVTISWLKPTTGSAITYYKVEKIIVSSQAISEVNNNIPANIFLTKDNQAQIGISVIYRVRAGNNTGLLSKGVDSSAVTPSTGTPSSARVDLISESPGSSNNFGRQMAFSSDGNTIIIGERFGNTGGITNAGTAQLFTKLNGVWSAPLTLTAQVPSTGARFGSAVAISDDGSTLVIGGEKTDSVEIYTMQNSKWVFSQLIPTSSSPGSFGYSVAFHPNSALLAIGNTTDTVNSIAGGSVQLFSKQSPTSQWIFSKAVPAKTPNAGNKFGAGVSFSPDGSTLAVSEPLGDTTTAIDAGTVQLFTSSNGTDWTLVKVLESAAPKLKYNFGGNGIASEFNFSPDGKTIAIGEFGNNNVQLFNKSTGWGAGQVIADTNGGFGIAVSYSVDGNTLAVGRQNTSINGFANAGSVILYNKSGSDWSYSKTLSALVPKTNKRFGFSLLFSPVSNELAICELNGQTKAANDAGVVTIIDLSQLP